MKVLSCFVGVAVLGGALTTPRPQANERPRLRLLPLEIRGPAAATYSVPSNIDAARIRLGFTADSLRVDYLERCRHLGIGPVAFDATTDLSRAIAQLTLTLLGAISDTGYRRAALSFFATVERDLQQNPPVLEKFRALFGSDGRFRTRIWEYVQDDLARQSKPADLGQLARTIASLEGYRTRFPGRTSLRPEEWSHPAYLFYRLDNYRHASPETYSTILKEARAHDPQAASDLESVLASYEKGARWLSDAARFFLNETWVYDDARGTFASLKERLADLWTPLLGHLPPLKPQVVRGQGIDATAVQDRPFRDFPGLLVPLNADGERFLKDTPLSSLSAHYDPVRRTEFPDEAKILPPGVTPAALFFFIGSLRNFDAQLEHGTDQYDIGSPVTFIIENLPHELGHFLYSCVRSGWAKEYRANQIVAVKKVDAYKSEGIAELCQSLVLESLNRRYPMLGYSNLLKHHIFIQDATERGHNHHTWGLLWMKTVFEIRNRNFAETVFLASQPGRSFEELMASLELQTDWVRTVPAGVGTTPFPRQKQEPGRTHSMVFPSCILEVEGGAFRIVEHGDYSVFVAQPRREQQLQKQTSWS